MDNKITLKSHKNCIEVNDETFVSFDKIDVNDEDDYAAKMLYSLMIHLNYEPRHIMNIINEKLANGELN